jgi:hypothetical protein
MSFYVLKICKSKGAYESIPKEPMKLNLDTIEQKVVEAGYEIICNAKVMLIVDAGCEVSIFPNGQLLLKTVSEQVAKSTAEKVYELIFKAE